MSEWQPPEIWRPIQGYIGKYLVSNLGRICTTDGKAVGQWENSQGYLLARLSAPRTVVRVHRVVARSFIPNPNDAPVVNHVDHARSHNTYTNLEWCTQPQNLQHASDAGRMQRDYWTGKRSPNAVLTDDEVRKMRHLHRSGAVSLSAVGAKFGVSKRCAGRAIAGETYRDVR